MSFLSGKDVWRLDQEFEATVPACLSPIGQGDLGTRLARVAIITTTIVN